jgi:hypothetical protein
MSTKKIKFIVAIGLALVFALALVISLLAQNAEELKYGGTNKCKPCHLKQHKSWEATSHANNFQLIVDTGKDKDVKCLKCHATGYGEPGGFVDAATTPNLVGTGCEACHGPGSKHLAIKKKEEKKGTMGEVKKGTCEKCHMPHGGHPELGKEILPVLKKKLSALQARIAGVESK